MCGLRGGEKALCASLLIVYVTLLTWREKDATFQHSHSQRESESKWERSVAYLTPVDDPIEHQQCRGALLSKFLLLRQELSLTVFGEPRIIKGKLQ